MFVFPQRNVALPLRWVCSRGTHPPEPVVCPAPVQLESLKWSLSKLNWFAGPMFRHTHTHSYRTESAWHTPLYFIFLNRERRFSWSAVTLLVEVVIVFRWFLTAYMWGLANCWSILGKSLRRKVSKIRGVGTMTINLGGLEPKNSEGLLEGQSRR